MNLFEKIFNHGILSRLEDSGTFMVTAHERGWLKTMLLHSAAPDAFAPETLKKLALILEQEQQIVIDEDLIEKARSMERQVYHPHLRTLRRIIVNRNGIRLGYTVKNGQAHQDQEGLPYKLEYSMVKREWYLLWYHMRNGSMMSTRLAKIAAIAELPLAVDLAERLLADIQAKLHNRMASAKIQVMQEYNRELSRILYAFSCFEKDVDYHADTDCYTIALHFANNESEYVLSKIRFLGKRVKIVDGKLLQRRMYESATKALQLYGVTE